MANKRNYGIDLLRIILMYMVCMLHTLGQGGVLDACQIGTIEYKTYWFLEIFSYCAVDGFGIISGYMATDKPEVSRYVVSGFFLFVCGYCGVCCGRIISGMVRGRYD